MLYNSGSTSRKSEKALRSVKTKLYGVKNQFCLPNYANDSGQSFTDKRFSGGFATVFEFGALGGPFWMRRRLQETQEVRKVLKTLGNPPNQKSF